MTLESRLAHLFKTLEQICIDSNGDWKERRRDPQKALDDIHLMAVDAYYGASDPTLSVVGEVLSERARQISKGYDQSHDDEHNDGMMALQAAAAIARYKSGGTPPWWVTRTQSRRAQIVQGIALAVAEVERIDRLAGRI